MRVLGILAALLLAGPAAADGLAVWPSPRAVAPAADGTLGFDLVVVNATAEEAREVVLTDALPAGTSLVSATPAPRVEADRLVWSLGDLAPSEAARVHLVLDGADAGAVVRATLGGTARRQVALPVTTVADVALLPDLTPTIDADAADPEVLAAVSALGGDPDRIADFVTNDVGYQAYRGSLRGARGTLWTGAGNALDQASLLVAMLRAAGYPARYVGGTLADADAAARIRAMFPPETRVLSAAPDPDATVAAALDPDQLGAVAGPEAFAAVQQAGADAVRASMFPDPAADPELLAMAKDHAWVEVLRDGSWQAVDPTLPGAAPPADGERRDEVAAEQRHTATFVLSAETYNPVFGGVLPRAEAERMRVTVPVVELVGRPVALIHRVNVQRQGGAIFSVTNYTYEPVLLVDGKTRAEAPAFQETYSNFPGGNLILTGLFLDVTLESPGADPIHTRHTLLDRLGAAQRDGAQDAAPPALDGQTPAVGDTDVTLLGFAAGATPVRVLAGMRPLLDATEAKLADLLPKSAALQGLQSLNAAQRRTVAEANRLATETGHVMAETLSLRLLHQSDLMSAAIAQDSGVVAYPDRPRLVVVTAHYSAQGSLPSIDLAANRMRVVAPQSRGKAAARSFRAEWGLAQARLEGHVVAELTGRAPVVALDTVFAAAEAQGIAIRLVDEPGLYELYRTGMSDDARARITAAVRSGKFVLTPEREVQIDGVPHLVWLEIDPDTGESVSVDAAGGRPALLEYGAVLELAGNYGSGVITGELHGWALGMFAGIPKLVGSLTTKLGAGESFEAEESMNDARFACFTTFLEKLGGPFDKLQRGLKLKKEYDEHAAAGVMLWVLHQMADFLKEQMARQSEGLEDYFEGYSVGLCYGQVLAAIHLQVLAAQFEEIDPALPVGGAGAAEPLRRPLNEATRDVALAADASPVVVPAHASTDPVRLDGDLDLSVDGPLALPAGHLVADGQLTDTDGMVVSNGPVELDVDAPLAAGAVELAGTGRLARYGDAAGAVFDAVTATTGSLTFVDADGRALSLAADGATLAGSGPVALPARFDATTAGAKLWLGAEAFGGFAGRVTAADDVSIAGAAQARLALTVPADPAVARGDDVEIALAATSTAGGDHTWHAEAPDGWTVTLTDDRLVATPAPGIPAGQYPLRLWIATPDGALAAGAALTATIGEGAGGVAASLEPRPLFTFGTAFGPAPLVFRAEVVNHGAAAADVPLQADAPDGFAAMLAAPSLPLAPGAHGEVHLDLVPVDDPPPVGTPLTVTLHAGDADAQATVPTPPLLGAEVSFDPPLLHVAPGGQAQAQLVLRARGNVPGVFDLAVADSGPLHLQGVPASVPLNPGDEVSLPVTATLAQDAVPAVGYAGGVSVTRDDLDVGQAVLGVRVVGPEAGDAIAVAAAAQETGRTTLAAVMESLSVRLDQVRQQCEPNARHFLARELRVMVAELGDPVFDDPAGQIRAASFALDDTDHVSCDDLAQQVFAPLQAAFTALPALLRAVADYDFGVSLDATYALVAPGQDAHFVLNGTQRGRQPVTINVELLDVPGQVVGPLPAPGLIPLTVTPPGPGRYTFRVRATAAEAPAIVREVTGTVVVEEHPVEVVQVGADPPFALPGARLGPVVRLFNAANLPQDLFASVDVHRPDGSLLYASPQPVPVRLAVEQAVQRFTLGDVPTLGEPEGVYAIHVALRQAADAPDPIAEGAGSVLLGQPLTADIATEPPLLPPGDVDANIAITARRRPVPALPGVRNPTEIDLFTSSAAGPVGLAVTDDGTIYVSNFGSGNHIPEGSPGAGNSITRITPAGEVSHFATVPEGPTDMTIGPDGALYVANAGSPERITRVSLPDGATSTWFDFTQHPPAGGTNNPLGIAFDSRGALYASELYDLTLFTATIPGTKVFKVTPDANGDGQGDAAFTYARNVVSPTRMTIDRRTDELIVCDAGNHRLVRIPTSVQNTANPVELLPGLENPQGVAFDASDNLYVLDYTLGTIDVYPTSVVDGHTTIAGPAVRWLDGLHTPITLVFAPDGAAITTNGTQDQVLRIRTAAPEDAPAFSFGVEHRFVGEGVDPASGSSDVAADPPRWDVDRVTWQAQVPPDTASATFRYRQSLHGLVPGERRPLSDGTTVTFQVGDAQTRVELPPLVGVVDHLVGLAPDRLEAPRDVEADAQVVLRNHRDVPDTITLALDALPDGVRATLDETQVEVAANGEARVTLRFTADASAAPGLFRYAVSATSSFGATDRVVGEIDVLGGLDLTIDPPEQTAHWGQQVTYVVHVANNTASDLRLEGTTEGLAAVNDDTRVLAQPQETREQPIFGFGLAHGRSTTVNLRLRPIGPAGTFAFRVRLANTDAAAPPVAAAADAVLHVVRGRHVSVTLDAASLSVPPDSPRIVTATVRNEGDITAAYDLTNPVLFGWTATYDHGPLVLAPGESRRVPLSIRGGMFLPDATLVLSATDADFAESRAQAGVALHVGAVGITLAVEPANAVAQDGEAHLVAHVRRNVGTGVFDLSVDGPIAFDPQFASPQADTTQRVDVPVALTLRGLAGLGPGPWPVRVRATLTTDPTQYWDAVGYVTVPAGGLTAAWEDPGVDLPRPAPTEAGLTLTNGDFAHPRDVTVTLASDPPGLVATADPTDAHVPPGVGGRVGVAIDPPGPGQWTLHATVDDGTAQQTVDLPVTVGVGQPPVIVAAGVDPPPVEGSPATLAVQASDPDGDPLVYDADTDGDGQPDVVASAQPAFAVRFADDGDFTLHVVARDPLGNHAEADVPVHVANVAPVFRSGAPDRATEGDDYAYAPDVFDPGADPIGFTFEGPAGATFDDTGVHWTPTFDQALAGTADFRLAADDGDGGRAEQAWTVTVSLRDHDGDGQPDTCQSRFGDRLFGDDDGDGRTNLEECLRGTPADVDGRPDAPRPVRPVDEAADPRATFEIEAATDPDGDALTYVFQVRHGEDVVVESDPQAELTWQPADALPDGDYTWRARANDGAADGPWSDDEAFVVGRGDLVVDAAVPDAAIPDAAIPGMDAAIPGMDAAIPAVDAAIPAVDAALPDAAPDAALPDAALPDASLPDATPDGALPDAAHPAADATPDAAPDASALDAGPHGGARDSGCDCDVAAPDPSALPALLLLAGLIRRRRR